MVGVNVAVVSVVLLNCEVLVFAEPARMLQAPVPFTGVLAASVVETALRQNVWSGPALATVVPGAAVMVTCELLAVQGALLMVHWKM